MASDATSLENYYDVCCGCVLLATSPYGMGFCFAYWHAKAVALRCNGVEWKSPGVMNPHVMFD